MVSTMKVTFCTSAIAIYRGTKENSLNLSI